MKQKLNFNPEDFSSQPETFRVSRVFDQSPSDIWSELISYEGMVQWVPGISHVHVTPNAEGTNGIGCTRVCQFGSETLHEDIVLWKEEQAYGYKIHDNNLIEDHVAYVTLENMGNSRTKVTWIQHMKPKGNILKTWLMKNLLFPRTIKKALQNLDNRIAA